MAAAAKVGKRRIIVCADGTWNKPDRAAEVSNVVRVARSVLPHDAQGTTQMVYYHSGVGERGGIWDHLTGGALGAGLSANIKDLYLFLICNYHPGDELFLFGFSRGAYTARSLAGLIRNCGILKAEHIDRYDDAYKLYRDDKKDTEPDGERAKRFRGSYSWPDFNIRFIGVWDTVGALGLPVVGLRFWTRKKFAFHDVSLSRSVDFAYHALAIDERRPPFQPTLWQQHPAAPTSQVLEQAWFPGVHADVGGSYPQTGLSDGALRWMCDRAEKAGLALNGALLPKAGNPDGRLHNSMTLFYWFSKFFVGDGRRNPGATMPAGKEALHVSATQRRNYRPAVLRKFLGEKPPISQP
jgi:uncharacterized protein (DUF2235 family)